MSTFLPFWGCKCGAVVRALSSHQCGPGFKSQCQRYMWVEFVVGSLPCSERFFSGFSGFPSPDKPTFPNSNSTSNQVDEGPQSGCATFKSLCILFIHSFIHSFIHPSVRPSVRPSVHPSIHPSIHSFIYLFSYLLDLSLFTCSPYCLSFFFHHQAQKKERSTNVQKRIRASFSKLTT